MSKAVLQHVQQKSRVRAAPSFTPVRSGLLQRKCACGGTPGPTGECEACKKKRSGLQTKLKVNEPGDSYEQVADRIADQVTVRTAHQAAREGPLRIQRYSGPSNGQMDVAPASVDQALASPGRPLEPALRQDMEQRFGYDFARVRVHSGAAAEQSTRDVSANAYTVGHNVVFGAGRFAPGTHEGRRLIAHELTHVVQQRGGGAPPGPAQERDAEAASFAVVAGTRPAVGECSRVGLAAQPIGGSGARGPIASGPKRVLIASGGGGMSEKEALAAVGAIESNWKTLTTVATPYPELKQWVAQGDTVVALIQTHVKAALNAISAKDDILLAAYKQVLESDKIMYDFISWSVVPYANLLSLRSGIDGLLNAFDHDSDVGFGFHYFRKFTGRANAEHIARQLKKWIDGVPAHSAGFVGLVSTFTVQSVSQPITVTSAYIPAARAKIEEQIRAMVTLQVEIQRDIDYENQFLDEAFKEGGQQAIDNVKEYYKLKKSIEKKDPEQDPKQETENAPQPQPIPVPIPDDGGKKKKKKRPPRMKSQIQEYKTHYGSAIATAADDTKGVTALEFEQAQADAKKNALEPADPRVKKEQMPGSYIHGVDQAKSKQSQLIRTRTIPGGGIPEWRIGDINELRVCFDPKTTNLVDCGPREWVRLDVENIEGHNLRFPK